MKKSYLALLLGAFGLAGLAGNASAYENVGFSISMGSPPAYYGPTYYAPPPGHVAPQMVRYAPPPVAYYRPAPTHFVHGPFVGFNHGPQRHFGPAGHGFHRGWHGHPGR